MEFKKLGAVEMVEAVSDAASVLIEEDGVIKRAPKKEFALIGKELVYEWNFSADDEVCDVIETVNDDLSWIVEKHDDIGWEIAITAYAEYYQDDNYYTNPNLTTTMFTTDTSYYTSYQSNQEMCAVAYGYAPEDLYNDLNIDYIYPECDIFIYNQVHFDNSWVPTRVDVGGTLKIESYTPLKSIKIYKIIR